MHPPTGCPAIPEPPRLRLTLRQLEYVVAVAELGSIAKAAERLNVSGPSISTAIKQMETELGLQMFARRPTYGLTLTPGGRQVAVAARQALGAVETVVQVAADLQDELSGRLALGCLTSLAPLVLPELRARFQAQAPRVRITQVEDSHAGLMDALRAGKIDCALTYDLPRPNGVQFEALAPVAPAVALPPEHPLAQQTEVTLADLRAEPLVLLDLPGSTPYFLDAFEAAGLAPKVAVRTPDMSVARSMAANGFGLLLVNARPLSDVAPDGKPLVYRPLLHGPRTLMLGLARPSDAKPSRVVEGFSSFCWTTVLPGRIPGIQP